MLCGKSVYQQLLYRPLSSQRAAPPPLLNNEMICFGSHKSSMTCQSKSCFWNHSCCSWLAQVAVGHSQHSDCNHIRFKGTKHIKAWTPPQAAETRNMETAYCYWFESLADYLDRCSLVWQYLAAQPSWRLSCTSATPKPTTTHDNLPKPPHQVRQVLSTIFDPYMFQTTSPQPQNLPFQKPRRSSSKRTGNCFYCRCLPTSKPVLVLLCICQ